MQGTVVGLKNSVMVGIAVDLPLTVLVMWFTRINFILRWTSEVLRVSLEYSLHSTSSEFEFPHY